MSLMNSILFSEPDTAAMHLLRIRQVTEEINEAMEGFVADTTELSNLGKNLNNLMPMVKNLSDANKRVTEITDTTVKEMLQAINDAQEIEDMAIHLS